MKIFNEFGIKPTTNCKAAGYDFYIPNIQKPVEECGFILEAFSKSYNLSLEQLNDCLAYLELQVSSVYGADKWEGQEMNILFLFLALDSDYVKESENAVETFVDDCLIFDKDGKPGIKPCIPDHVFFNSGIHVALNPGTAGIFFNKSGRGIKGWDVRAQVVDEDYSGLVHLSLAYTKNNLEDGVIYVGDKITQMVIVKIENGDVEDIDRETYMALMSNSERGDKGFGSSNEKH